MQNKPLAYFALKGRSFAPTRAKHCPSQGKNVLTKGKIWEKNVRDVNLYFLLAKGLSYENPFTLHLFYLTN